MVWMDGRDAPLQNGALLDRVTDTQIRQSGQDGNWSVTQTADTLYTQILGNSSADRDFWIGQNMNIPAQTIEAVLHMGSDCSAFCLGLFRPKLQYIHSSKTVSYWYSYDNMGSLKITDNAVHLVGRPGVITINGKNYTTDSGFNSMEFNSLIICRGGFGDRNFCYGALRAYDRVLSDEEVLQNYNFEKSIGRAI